MSDDAEGLAKGLSALLQAADRLEHLDDLAEQVRRLADERAGEDLAASDELRPDRAYDYGEVADYIGVQRDSVRKISKAELPRCRGAHVLGVDIMAYRGEITWDEAGAYKEARRRRVVRHISEAA